MSAVFRQTFAFSSRFGRYYHGIINESKRRERLNKKYFAFIDEPVRQEKNQEYLKEQSNILSFFCFCLQK